MSLQYKSGQSQMQSYISAGGSTILCVCLVPSSFITIGILGQAGIKDSVLIAAIVGPDTRSTVNLDATPKGLPLTRERSYNICIIAGKTYQKGLLIVRTCAKVRCLLRFWFREKVVWYKY